MNKLKGHIVSVESSGNISIVDIALDKDILVSAVVIETSDTASYLSTGNEIHVLFKETEVMLSRDPEVDISLVNRIPAKLTDLVIGDLFCEVTLKTPVGEIKSVISKAALERWPIKRGEGIIALIKINEIMLQE